MEDNSRKPKNRSQGDLVFPSVERVRTRWTPKPEQILILESIFNSGMVNPPKEDSVRIRKLLERFGSVGDANVFYWFQNRRSRSRRRQRQLQAELTAESRAQTGRDTPPLTNYLSNSLPLGLISSSTFSVPTLTDCSSNFFETDSAEDLFSISRQMGFTGARRTSPPQLGLMTVFINGIPQEVPSGTFNARRFFGEDAILLHSSGELIPMNDCGILFRALHEGESYILVNSSRLVVGTLTGL